MLYSACDFPHGSLGARDGAPPGDAADAPMIDAMIDGPAPLCYGRAPFTVCLSAEPSGAVVLAGSIESTACTYNGVTALPGEIVTAENGSMVCVVAGASIDMTGISVGTSGDKPVVLIASGNITVPSGTRLDASSATNNVTGVPTGPGFDPPDCGAPAPGGANDNGAGGGAGGSFGSVGGNGAAGVAAAGGTAKPAAMNVVTLRGGCPGGDGGAGTNGGVLGGPGGGAIALFAHGMLMIDGTVTASGAAGVGGKVSRGGGGGGGSGGMIVMHAQTIMIGGSAVIVANGGGGGGGAGNSSSGGENGTDAGSLLTTPAAGGNDTGGGASVGGNGATKGAPAQDAPSAANGGGGGGGGLGIIRVLSGLQQLNTARFSPNPS